ncbi:excalibur calcium-binding domain-containing protein [Streptomyces sp. NPDC088910]|uniref:excalibur calcium-binding domain-containing protein n=1 Tax=Streptomyces sp. NPDC088910 TaxID=3365911 RepID=UPI0037FDD8C5
MARVRLLPATLLVAVTAATAAACGSTDGNSSAGVTVAPSAPGATVTTTVTTPNPPPATPTPTPTAPTTTTTATATATATATDPTTVVSDYFAAINARDFGRAWALGGKNVSSSYSAFVNGFSSTSEDVVTVLASTPTTVTVHLDATQTDGTVKSFEGTYSVDGGRITGASVHAVPGSGAETTGPPATTYKDCTDAHDHGASDIPSSDPRYRPKLDRDHDGLACEPSEGAAP